MAKREERSGSSVTTAAEIVGRTAGQAAGVVDAFRSRHPHPISDVGEALTAGQEALTDLPAQARAGSAAVVAKTMDAAERAQTIVRRARRRTVKTLARAKRATRKAVTHTKKVARTRSPSAAASSARRRPSLGDRMPGQDDAFRTLMSSGAKPIRRPAYGASRPAVINAGDLIGTVIGRCRLVNALRLNSVAA
jgi:hypothetical protein